MAFLRSLCLLALSAVLSAASGSQGTGLLTYRVKLRMQGEARPIETRCMLVPTPVAATANRVKKARMGGWRLEAQQAKDAPFSQAMVLARVERMLYFSGPVPELEPRDLLVHFGDKACRVWAARMPANLNAYAYLVEVAPGLLALSYFSGSFAGGDVASLEIQLDSFRLEPGVAPAEAGTALVQTLRRLAQAPKEAGPDDGVVVVP